MVSKKSIEAFCAYKLQSIELDLLLPALSQSRLALNLSDISWLFSLGYINSDTSTNLRQKFLSMEVEL